MQIELSEDLRPALEQFAADLQIQGRFVPEQDILEGYLKRGFGNAYDFDQRDRLEQVI